MSRICLYYKPEEVDRWVRGDRYVRRFIRRIVRGKPRPSGIDRVFLNLVLGLERIGLPYEVNLPFKRLREDDTVGVLGRGRGVLRGYERTNPIVGAIALMTHPSEWPTLCDEYPVVTYLSHSAWVNDIYHPFFGDRCKQWPVGIDTTVWKPRRSSQKTVDVLIYDKLRPYRELDADALLGAVRRAVAARRLSCEEIRYGSYEQAQYQAALERSRMLLFLSPHESQGIAYQEAMAMGVPVVAWDPGESVDPQRFAWGTPHVPTTSVPYFDERCGVRFRDLAELDGALKEVSDRLAGGALDPRGYVMEHLTLEKCAAEFVNHLDESQTPAAQRRLSPVWVARHRP